MNQQRQECENMKLLSVAHFYKTNARSVANC